MLNKDFPTTPNIGNNKSSNLPRLFDKKIKAIKVIKPLTRIVNDTDRSRHFTPAAQEWYNSIYNYNPNYLKALPVADLSMMKLLKAYFNSELKETLTKTKGLIKPNSNKRIKRMSTKRIFVGKGEVKHSNDKAIVTFYIHNAERLFLDRKITLLSRALYDPARRLIRNVYKNKDKIVRVTYNRILSFKEFWHLIGKSHYYKKWCSKQFVENLDLRNLVLKNINNIYIILKKMVIFNLITEEYKNKTFVALCEKIMPILPNPQFEEIMPLYEKYYITHLNNFKLKKLFNRNKFRSGFINKLLELVEEIYGKKVEFNIVKLKKLHLNSDIYTQTVALKLKNRNNNLKKVLQSSLNKAQISTFFREAAKHYDFDRNDLLINIIRNDKVTSMFGLATAFSQGNMKQDNVNDPLSTLLLDMFTNAEDSKVISRKAKSGVAITPVQSNKLVAAMPRTTSLQKYIFESLKHLSMRGIRIEVKGRATRRLTAARSIFKMKWKGGLKNIDSSFKGLSTILLRGHLKSNIQHTYISTKNRNGAIGVKGWVSSK